KNGADVYSSIGDVNGSFNKMNPPTINRIIAINKIGVNNWPTRSTILDGFKLTKNAKMKNIAVKISKAVAQKLPANGSTLISQATLAARGTPKKGPIAR